MAILGASLELQAKQPDATDILLSLDTEILLSLETTLQPFKH